MSGSVCNGARKGKRGGSDVQPADKSISRIVAIGAIWIGRREKRLKLPAVTPSPSEKSSKDGTAVERTVALLLRPFAEVKPIEVAGVLLLMGTGLILMASYYMLKVTREPLIIAAPHGAEMKSFASAGQALVLLLMTRGYRALADRLARRPLTIAVYGFFAAMIALFAVAERAQLPVGIPFFIFVGIFNLTVLSQFWSVANDFYTEEQGKRVFAILGVGTALGAIVGSWAGGQAFELFKTTGTLTASIVLLMLGLGGVLGADLIIRRRKDAATPAEKESDEKEEPPGEDGKKGIDRYLILLAVLILALNAFNSIGEYILDHILTDAVQAKHGTSVGPEAEAQIASFKSTYFLYFNSLTLFLQLFVASRAIRWMGAKNAVFILPIVALIGYGGAAFVPLLSVILVVKVAENAVDYSIQNTAWQSLFLVLTRREKYVAKNTIDTLFVRFGDVTAAVVVGIFGYWLDLPTIVFILINIGVGAAWLFAVWLLRIEYPKKAARTAKLTGEPVQGEPQTA